MMSPAIRHSKIHYVYPSWITSSSNPITLLVSAGHPSCQLLSSSWLTVTVVENLL